jgi:hypothetical protein
MRIRPIKGRKTRRQRGGQQKPIIVLQLRWGFGNQIIQYFVARAVQKKFGYTLYILPAVENVHANNRDYRDLFIRGEKIDKSPENFTDPYVANKNGEALKISEIPEGKNIFIERLGHFYEVFEDIMPELSSELNGTLAKRYPNLKSASIKNGFIHVRRGDTINAGWSHTFDFFNKALIMANKTSTVETWHIFSDDLKWCKEQSWDGAKKIKFVNEPDEIKALALMSRCKGGAILGNSTFSWAGAMLGANTNKNSVIIANIGMLKHSDGGKHIGPSHWTYLDDEGNEEEYK